MEKIRVENLTKVFGNNPKRGISLLNEGWSKTKILKETGMTVGVNNASFEVNDGEVFVIMGLSGSGKSTLVRLLNRLIEPTSGRVLLDGDDLTKVTPEKLREIRRKKMSMVFQNFGLFPHRTILDNVAYGLEIQGVDRDKRYEQSREAIKTVGLDGYEDSLPENLSGGMKQRVGLARALANAPDILLMDEAFSALDPLIRKDMQDELLDLQDVMQKTIIFITHDLDEALKLGDRIALMKDGSIVQIGTPEEILTSPENEYVERFVEDAAISKVLTVEHVMNRPETVTPDKGPRVALQLMKDRGVSSIYVVDRKKTLIGLVTADGARKAKDEGTNLESVLIKDIPQVAPETKLNDIFELAADSRFPIGVVNKENKLLGVLVRGSVLGGLAGKISLLDDNGTEDKGGDRA